MDGSSERGASYTAVHVQVWSVASSSTPPWDSGTVATNATSILYSGKSLAARSDFSVKLRLLDSSGAWTGWIPRGTSAPACSPTTTRPRLSGSELATTHQSTILSCAQHFPVQAGVERKALRRRSRQLRGVHQRRARRRHLRHATVVVVCQTRLLRHLRHHAPGGVWAERHRHRRWQGMVRTQHMGPRGTR